jgi:hypothetical protein
MIDEDDIPTLDQELPPWALRLVGGPFPLIMN